MDKSKRRFDFIDEKKWKKLSKDEFKLLMSYKGIYSSLLRSERKIERLKEQISSENQKILDYHLRLTEKNHHIEHIRKTFVFGISVILMNKHYYYLTINRTGRSPKNCSLGREEVIYNHLLKYYKGRRSKLKEIKGDWKGFLKSDQELYDKILNMILEDRDRFENDTINKDVLFPLT